MTWDGYELLETGSADDISVALVREKSSGRRLQIHTFHPGQAEIFERLRRQLGTLPQRISRVEKIEIDREAGSIVTEPLPDGTGLLGWLGTLASGGPQAHAEPVPAAAQQEGDMTRVYRIAEEIRSRSGSAPPSAPELPAPPSPAETLAGSEEPGLFTQVYGATSPPALQEQKPRLDAPSGTWPNPSSAIPDHRASALHETRLASTTAIQDQRSGILQETRLAPSTAIQDQRSAALQETRLAPTSTIQDPRSAVPQETRLAPMPDAGGPILETRLADVPGTSTTAAFRQAARVPLPSPALSGEASAQDPPALGAKSSGFPWLMLVLIAFGLIVVIWLVFFVAEAS